MDINTVYSTRYLCDIIEDMRTMYKTRNFSYMEGLLEELQYRANRMENLLSIRSDVERYGRRREELKKEIEKLEKEREELK